MRRPRLVLVPRATRATSSVASFIDLMIRWPPVFVIFLIPVRLLGDADLSPTLGAIVDLAANVEKISIWSSTSWFVSLVSPQRFLGDANLGPTLGAIVDLVGPGACRFFRLPGCSAAFTGPGGLVAHSRLGVQSNCVWLLSPGE